MALLGVFCYDCGNADIVISYLYKNRNKVACCSIFYLRLLGKEAQCGIQQVHDNWRFE